MNKKERSRAQSVKEIIPNKCSECKRKKGASMNVREYLKNYNQIGSEIRRLNSELNRLLVCREDTYNTLKAQVIDGMPKKQRLDGVDIVSESVLFTVLRFGKSIELLGEQINNLLNQCDLFNNIWSNSAILKPEERKIIELRYFDQLTWEIVAYKMNYSQRQCKRLVSSALKILQNNVIILQKGYSISHS